MVNHIHYATYDIVNIRDLRFPTASNILYFFRIAIGTYQEILKPSYKQIVEISFKKPGAPRGPFRSACSEKRSVEEGCLKEGTNKMQANVNLKQRSILKRT